MTVTLAQTRNFTLVSEGGWLELVVGLPDVKKVPDQPFGTVRRIAADPSSREELGALVIDLSRSYGEMFNLDDPESQPPARDVAQTRLGSSVFYCLLDNLDGPQRPDIGQRVDPSLSDELTLEQACAKLTVK